ncbi:PREDICTED: SIFamide-related peptide [Trachymyrmex septentrionalis]|uniref:SIFamide-related peptide n=1 Tax=Trachymyrmex septentrionalis TaxID=34720 RepID=UPI00084F7D9C|nr:PREDICTED: SIFamide-related peptide [Trachymyrmex septentrionalis]XP_018346527.1 PREDICTED: SIFamide-related peptide [Trachymyrmex septentrionalis]
MVSIRLILTIAVIMVAFVISANAAYKKPPFNGSIFGKRSNTVTDYEITTRGLSAICEVASETCTAWLSRQESN